MRKSITLELPARVTRHFIFEFDCEGGKSCIGGRRASLFVSLFRPCQVQVEPSV